MTNTRRLLATSLAALVVLLAAGFGVWRWRAAHKKPPVEFDTAAVDRGRIVARVTATGTLSALVTVQVGTQVSGTVQKLFVDFNSPVKKGQLIAKIDPQLFEASLAAGAGQLRGGRGEPASRPRRRSATPDGSSSARRACSSGSSSRRPTTTPRRRTWRSTKGQTAAARGSLAQAKAALHQAKVNLDYTRIVSPTDGTVISRSVDVGQTVAASLPAPTLFVIAQDLRQMQVDTSVAEADVGKLSTGDAGDLHGRRVPGRALPRHGPPDPQRAADGAERGHLRRGHRRRQPRPEAASGHDRQRHLHLRRRRTTCCGCRTRRCAFGRRRRSSRRWGFRFRRRCATRPSAPGPAPVQAAPGAAEDLVRGRAERVGRAPVVVVGARAGAAMRRAIGEPSGCCATASRRRLPLRVGLSDGNVTEVVEGDLHEGRRAHRRCRRPPRANPRRPRRRRPGGMRRLF